MIQDAVNGLMGIFEGFGNANQQKQLEDEFTSMMVENLMIERMHEFREEMDEE